MCDESFQERLISSELRAWRALKGVWKKFLGYNHSKDFKRLLEISVNTVENFFEGMLKKILFFGPLRLFCWKLRRYFAGNEWVFSSRPASHGATLPRAVQYTLPHTLLLELQTSQEAITSEISCFCWVLKKDAFVTLWWTQFSKRCVLCLNFLCKDPFVKVFKKQ